MSISFQYGPDSDDKALITDVPGRVLKQQGDTMATAVAVLPEIVQARKSGPQLTPRLQTIEELVPELHGKVGSDFPVEKVRSYLSKQGQGLYDQAIAPLAGGKNADGEFFGPVRSSWTSVGRPTRLYVGQLLSSKGLDIQPGSPQHDAFYGEINVPLRTMLATVSELVYAAHPQQTRLV